MPENLEFSSKKRKILEEVEKRGGFHYSSDFVAPETYQDLFNRLDVRGKKILDLGAGDTPITPIGDHGSQYTDALKDKGAILVPFDRHEGKMRSWLLGKNADPSRYTTANEPVVGDVRMLPFNNESIDGAISINLMNSFQVFARSTVRSILREARRVLKPGAFFIISTFGYHDNSFRTDDGAAVKFSSSFPNNTLPRPVDLITPDVLKELAQQSGFIVEEELPIDRTRVEEERVHVKKFYKEQGNDIDVEMLFPIAMVLKKQV